MISPNADNPLTQMSGFGTGDGGWSGRVEERRQKKLLDRNRGTVRAAEVGDSGVIQPSAPPGPMPGSGQAISPTRLRRLVNVEVRCCFVSWAPACYCGGGGVHVRPALRDSPAAILKLVQDAPFVQQEI